MRNLFYLKLGCLTPGRRKKKKKERKKTLSNSGGKNTKRQALGPPPGPHNYFKGTRCCVIPGSGETWGRRRWLLVLIPVNPPSSLKPSPGEAKAAQHCPGAQGPLPLSSLKSMAELASFSSHVAYDAPNRARHHSEQHRGSSMAVAGCVSTRVCSPHQTQLNQQAIEEPTWHHMSHP